MANYFLERYAELSGNAPKAHLDYSVRPCLRINPLRAPEDIVERLRTKDVSLEKVSFLEHAYFYEADFSLGATEEYLLGYYYLQEAASQLPVLALKHVLGDALQGATVLDMAAAPGSKTTQLAAQMDNGGRIVALDADMNRCKSLGNNLERCGVTNAYVYAKDARYADDLGLVFDAVLLDAPCSGNLTLQNDWLDARMPGEAKQKAELQKELLLKAWSVLRPGGVLVYSTCSLEPEEDEAVLSVLPEGVLVDAGLGVGGPGVPSFRHYEFRSDADRAVRLWPHRSGTQGFFVAVAVKPA